MGAQRLGRVKGRARLEGALVGWIRFRVCVAIGLVQRVIWVEVSWAFAGC